MIHSQTGSRGGLGPYPNGLVSSAMPRIVQAQQKPWHLVTMPLMTKKKATKKKRVAKKRKPRQDFAQNALRVVEQAIGGKLAQ